MDLSRQSSIQSSIAPPPYTTRALSLSSLFSAFRASTSSLPGYEASNNSPQVESTVVSPQHGEVTTPETLEPGPRDMKQRHLSHTPVVSGVDDGHSAGSTGESQALSPPPFPTDKRRVLQDRGRVRALLPTIRMVNLGVPKRQEMQTSTPVPCSTEKERLRRDADGERRLVLAAPPVQPTPANDVLASTVLTSPSGHVWAALHLDGQMTPGFGHPTYQAGSRICGSLKLDLPNVKKFHFIELVLKGTITIESATGIPQQTDCKENFLSRRSVLWAPDMGNARDLVNHAGSSSTLDLVQVQLADVRAPGGVRQLFGRNESPSQDASSFIGLVDIPFEFLLPAITTRGTRDPESLPPSFEMSAHAKIEYSLAAVLHSGGHFTKSERISKVLNVLPKPSEECIPRGRRSRALAKPAAYRGRMVDSSEDFVLTCKMLYPQPAVYERGECISLHIQLASNQNNADRILDLLSIDSAATVCLIRTTTFGQLVDAKCVAMGLCWSSPENNSHPPGQNENLQSENSNVPETSAGRNGNVRTRIVHCELRLPPDLAPSFKFRTAKTSYKIAVLTFRHPHIVSTTLSELIAVPISVIAESSGALSRPFVSKAPPNLIVPELLPPEILPTDQGTRLVSGNNQPAISVMGRYWSL